MDTLKKYWWLFLLVPVVLYMVYIMMKENESAKPGTPAYARSFRWPGKKDTKEETQTDEVNPQENGRDNPEIKVV